jgi:CRP-like cAMP-binding protein
MSPDGNVVMLALRGPGEILGEMSVLGADDRSATVVAIERCESRIVLADRFLLLVRSLGLEEQFLQHAMSRIRESDAWRAELVTLPAGPRLARTLLRLAAVSASAMEIGLDQTELGQAVGLSRSTVAAELSRLREQGVIATGRRRVTITDLSRLRSLSELSRGNV